MQAAKMAGFYTFLTVALMGTLVALTPLEKEQPQDKKSILETKIGEFLKAHNTRKEQTQIVGVAKETVNTMQHFSADKGVDMARTAEDQQMKLGQPIAKSGSATSSETVHKNFMERLLRSGPGRQRQQNQDRRRNQQQQQQQQQLTREQLTEKLRLLLERAEKLKARGQASSDGDVKKASDEHDQTKTANTLSELFKRLGLNQAATHVAGRKASIAGTYRRRFRERLSNSLNQEQLEKPWQQRIMQGLNNDRRSHARKSPLRSTVNQRAQNSKTRSASGLRKRYLTQDYCYSVVFGAPYNNWNTWSSYNDYGSGYDWNTWSSYNDYGSGYNNWNTWFSYNDYGSGNNDWNTWSSYNDYGSGYGSGNNWNTWSSYNDYGSGYNDWNTWSSYNDYGSGNNWNAWSSYNDYGSGYNDWNTWSSYNDYGSGYGSGNNWNTWSSYNDYGSGYNDWNTWSSYNDYGSGYNDWNTWSSYNDYGSGYDNWNSWSSYYPYYDYGSGYDNWNSWSSYYDYGSGYPYNYDTSDFDMCIAMYFSGGAYSPSFNYSCEVPCSDKFGDEFVQCVYVKGTQLEDALLDLYNRPGSDEIVPVDLKEGVHQLMASNGYPTEIVLDIYKLYIQLLFQRVHEPTYSEEPSDLKCKFYNLMQVASDTMGLHKRSNAAHKRAQGVVITAPDDKGAKVQRPYTQAKTIE